MSTLKENYKNDVLDPLMNGKRKYEKTDNADGTLSLTDKTSYTQVGDNFGADDINAITHEINQINNNLRNLNVYSNDELEIGKWIDDKPIYRKCYRNFNLTHDTIIDSTLNYNYVDTVIDTKGSFEFVGENQIDSIDNFATSNQWAFIDVRQGGLKIKNTVPTSYTLYCKAFIIEYTKK